MPGNMESNAEFTCGQTIGRWKLAFRLYKAWHRRRGRGGVSDGQTAASRPRAGPDYEPDYRLPLKNWTSRSCCSAASRESKVPRFLRLPVLGLTFLE